MSMASINHGELFLGETCIALAGPYEPMRTASPRSLEERTTGFLYVYVDDVEAHHAGAAASGAEVKEAPADQGYGDRNYRSQDCEGRPWMSGSGIAAE